MVGYSLFVFVTGLNLFIRVQSIDKQSNQHNVILGNGFGGFDDFYNLYGGGNSRSMKDRTSKRGITTATVQGRNALLKLLKGAHFVQSGSSRFRRIEKIGMEEDAFEDFFSVNPSNVKKFESLRNGDAYVGQAGDLRLTLRPKGDRHDPGLPVIEIRSPANKIDDRIVYKPE